MSRLTVVSTVLGAFVALCIVSPPASAHQSVVQVTMDFELDAPQCLINFVTVRGRHTGRVIAIGFDDRNLPWSLYGGIGFCSGFFLNAKESPISEGLVRGIIEATPFLEVATQIDRRCTTLEDRKYWGRTRAGGGPWDSLNPLNDPAIDTECKLFRCS